MFYLDHLSCAKYNLFENSNMDIAPILFMGVHRELGRLETKFEEILKINYSPIIIISLRKDIKDKSLIKKLESLQKDLNDKFGGLTDTSREFVNSLDQVTLIGAFETFLKRIDQIEKLLDEYITNETALELLSDDFELTQFETITTEKEKPIEKETINSVEVEFNSLIEEIKNLPQEQKTDIVKKVIEVISEKQNYYNDVLKTILDTLL